MNKNINAHIDAHGQNISRYVMGNKESHFCDMCV